MVLAIHSLLCSRLGRSNSEVEAQLLRRTRVVLVDMPQLLRGIVREVLAAEPELELVGEFPESTGLAIVAERTDADIVVVGGRLGEGAPICALLEAHPRVRVLAIRADGRRGSLFWLAPERKSLGELSPEMLVQAIRDSAELCAREWWDR
jgi:DNA-binding NarL/FixJ family response regulator